MFLSFAQYYSVLYIPAVVDVGAREGGVCGSGTGLAAVVGQSERRRADEPNAISSLKRVPVRGGAGNAGWSSVRNSAAV